MDLPTRQTGALQNFRNGVLPVERHDMHTSHTGDGLYLANDFAADLDAFFGNPVVRHAAQTSDDIVWHAPGLNPGTVTKCPSLKNSVRTTESPLEATSNSRVNVSFAQLLPHVPESGESLAYGP